VSRFPHPVYAETILGPQFRESQKWLFDPMLDASEAHLLMLAECHLVPCDQAARVWHALSEIRRGGPDAFSYAPDVEDLFFQMEARITEIAGEEAGGNLHLARSRNDLDAAMARLTIRRLLLETHQALESLRATFLRLIGEHLYTLMPGHTHTQPAQPTTLAHYLASTAQALERDAGRIEAAFGCTNRGPLGAAALTTTGFSIDRELTARLLGFDGVVINSYDAIGAGEHERVDHLPARPFSSRSRPVAVGHPRVRRAVDRSVVSPDQQHHAAEEKPGGAGAPACPHRVGRRRRPDDSDAGPFRCAGRHGRC
jgi:argininosuccinate lyase